MKNIFLPPVTDYKDQDSIAKFNLTWKMNVFNSVFLAVIAVFYFFFEPEAFGAALYGWSIAFSLNVLLFFKKKYKIIGYIYAFHGCLFLIYTLNFMPNVIHAIEFFWMIVFTLYTFFALGKNAGYSLLFMNFIGIFCFFYFSISEYATHVEENLVPLKVTATVFNILLACLLAAYLINQFKNSTLIAQEKYKEAILELEKRNRLVEAQNEEKSIMLKEIHHRVKNNLQVITSLLRLQSREIKDEQSERVFKDAVHRVVAMSMIHEKMYQNENLSKIDLKNYLDTLSVELVNTYSDDEIVINLDIESQVENLSNNALVPIALIFNELISNSLKHAFTNRKEGNIKVDVRDLSDRNISLIYSDDGTWNKEVSENSFGLELIASLTEQLDGKVNRTYDGGTKYEFVLKNVD